MRDRPAFARQGGSFFCSRLPPGDLGFLGRFDRTACFGGAALGDLGNRFAIGGILNRESRAAIRVAPMTINKGL